MTRDEIRVVISILRERRIETDATLAQAYKFADLTGVLVGQVRRELIDRLAEDFASAIGLRNAKFEPVRFLGDIRRAE